jgi:hypothetical protein
MKMLEGIEWTPRYNEHMSCTKACLDYLGIDVSMPWLYGGTGNAFVININDTVNVDAAQAWDIDVLFDLAPNLGYTVERLYVPHEIALEMADAVWREKQREAWDFVCNRVDQGLPSYAWELSPVPNYYAIRGYDDGAYLYAGWPNGKTGRCPWDKLGSFDVKQLAVNCVHPAEPAPDGKVVKDALTVVAARAERSDGWSIGTRYVTGLPAYEMWAEALEKGRAKRDGGAYVTIVWREAREMAVEFLKEAKMRLPGVSDVAFDDAIAHYTTVRDKLYALSEVLSERDDSDWGSTVSSPEGAQLVREAGVAERRGVVALSQVAEAL